jgi:uncharacterized phage protein (TIGR02216 family)
VTRAPGKPPPQPSPLQGEGVRPFPWKDAMGFGFGTLRLSPDAFWKMTPRELAAAMEAVLGPRAAALDAASFAALRARFPDAPAA